MKTLILIFSVLVVLSCGNDNEQDESIITENVTIYFYFDAAFGTSECDYVIETPGGKIYKPKSYSNLSEFRNPIGVPNGGNSKTEVEISYRLTEESVDRCFHKEFDPKAIVIEIISIKRRGATLPTRN